MANGDNENQGNLDRNTTEKYLEEQKGIMTRLQQGEEANRDELINALDEMKKEEGQDQELVTYLNQAMRQLEAFPETLAPEMYRDVLGDVIDEMGDRQAGIFQSLLSEVGGLNDAMRSGFDRMSGVLGDAFSPLMELKEFGIGAFEMLKGGFEKISGIFGSVFGGREEEKQISILGSIKGYMSGLFDTQQEQLRLDERQYKAQQRKDTTGEEGGILSNLNETIVAVLIPALSALALAVGSLVGNITIQFKAFYNTFIRPLRWFIKTLSGLKFPSLTQSFVSLLQKIGSFFTKFGKLSSMTGKVMGYVGQFASRLGTVGQYFIMGFKKFAWPLTIIMGVIDFIQGFTSEQGSLVDKIKAGLQEAISGIIELPVRLLGWIADWVMGLFGVEIEGGAGEAMMGGIKKAVGFAIDAIIFPFKILYESINWLGGAIIDAGQFLGIFDALATTIKSVFDVIISPFQIMWSAVKGLWNLVRGDFESAGENFGAIVDQVTGLFGSLFNIITWPLRTFILNPIKSLIGWITSGGTGDGGGFSTAIDYIMKILGGIGDFIMTYTPIGWIYSGVKNLWSWLSGGEEGGEDSVFDTIMNKIKDVPGMIKDWILGMIPGKETLSNIGKGVVNIGKEAAEGVKNAAGAVGDAVSSGWNWLTGDEEGEESEPQRRIFQRGGPVKDTGIKKLHAGEYVLPKSAVDRMGGFDDVDRMAQTIGQQENERRNREAQDRVREQNSLLQKLDSIERSIRSTGETTTQESTPKVESEPPDEIESLALLLFNKSWGVT